MHFVQDNRDELMISVQLVDSFRQIKNIGSLPALSNSYNNNSEVLLGAIIHRPEYNRFYQGQINGDSLVQNTNESPLICLSCVHSRSFSFLQIGPKHYHVLILDFSRQLLYLCVLSFMCTCLTCVRIKSIIINYISDIY